MKRHALFLALASIASLAASTSHAFDISASAFQNLGYTDSESDGGSFVSASTPINAAGGYASAVTTRFSYSASAIGFGASTTTHYSALSSGVTRYALWDLTEDRALTDQESQGLLLDFNFGVTGSYVLEPVSLSGSLVSYAVSVNANETEAKLNGVYGPGPGGLQYLYLGDQSLVGEFDRGFSLLHADNATGVYSVSVNTMASNRGAAHISLLLSSVQYAPGSELYGPGLGIRLTETGEFLSVSPVPEASSLAMALSGLLVLIASRKAGAIRSALGS